MAGPSDQSRRSFFYVFGVSEESFDRDEKGLLVEVAPDSALFYAFGRLKEKFKDAEVDFTPSDNLRRALGIKSLPAFALSDTKLDVDKLRAEPPALPSPWNILKLKKRRQILEAGTYVPTVEREILSSYKTRNKMYEFVTDLHVENVDYGIAEAGRKIENEARKALGKKVANTITFARKIFHQ